MIRKPIKKRKSIKRNPDSYSEIIRTEITPIGSKYKVAVFAGTTKVLDVSKKFDSYSSARIIADTAKASVIKELRNAPKLRKNPDYKLNDSLSSSIGKSMALPESKEDVFELGKLYGLQVALRDYCGVLQYLDRRRVKKSIEKEISRALAGLARRVEIRGEGIEGPIPIVKRVQKT